MIGTGTSTLADKANRLLFCYALAADTRDFDRLRSLFAPDARLTVAQSTFEGQDECLAYFERTVNRAALSQHAITNVMIEPDAEGLFMVMSYVRALVFLDGFTRLVVGRYVDTVREEGEDLVFVHKRVVVDRVIELPAAQTPGS